LLNSTIRYFYRLLTKYIYKLFLAELFNPILIEVVEKIYLAMPFLSLVGKNYFEKFYFLDC
jgi:hypothetical protein